MTTPNENSKDLQTGSTSNKAMVKLRPWEVVKAGIYEVTLRSTQKHSVGEKHVFDVEVVDGGDELRVWFGFGIASKSLLEVKKACWMVAK